ncbi:PRKR-interacting protein 1 homolog [Scaptodrosophila lebanonensis]|uniref:PRKR-interacting protein 1 homolog n=1 Tax=Drosophila lebanonensis TaxID=7225 RepID=A0A6J2UGV4_DROLE|nr:PRKR-interacting protein 1 homolog [Scaptodrosophila lebanonensis]
MSFIKNLVKETEQSPIRRKTDADGSKSGEKIFVKTATDLQRLKLEKLMKNPDKPVVIPEQRREKDYMATVPTFVRNVMGSSAGAGSGEFHVYRHLRRKEYARQKNIQAKSAREEADEAYQQKLDDNRRLAEERTAKKRAKRMKKKNREKRLRLKKNTGSKEHSSQSSESASDEQNEADMAMVHKKLTKSDLETVETVDKA